MGSHDRRLRWVPTRAVQSRLALIERATPTGFAAPGGFAGLVATRVRAPRLGMMNFPDLVSVPSDRAAPVDWPVAAGSGRLPGAPLPIGSPLRLGARTRSANPLIPSCSPAPDYRAVTGHVKDACGAAARPGSARSLIRPATHPGQQLPVNRHAKAQATYGHRAGTAMPRNRSQVRTQQDIPSS
jgi:hypothetical protein